MGHNEGAETRLKSKKRIFVIADAREHVSISTAFAFRDIFSTKNVVDIIAFDSGIPINATADYIRKEKPDLVVLINILRDAFGGALPGNVRVATWLQDDVSHIVARTGSESFAKTNDLIFGYVQMLQKYGYDSSRCMCFPMLVSPLRYDDWKKNRTDKKGITFISNRGESIEQYVETISAHWMNRYNVQIPSAEIIKCAKTLERIYRDGTFGAFHEYAPARAFFMESSAISNFVAKLDKALANEFLNIYMYWGVCERIYRQTYVKWLIDFGVKPEIYGAGWKDNPEFSEYAHGLVMPNVLGPVYGKYEHSLHLNSFEGHHQRIYEILCSGATPITRGPVEKAMKEPKKFVMSDYRKFHEELVDRFNGFVFDRIKPEHNGSHLFMNTLKLCRVFNSKSDLKNILKKTEIIS